MLVSHDPGKLMDTELSDQSLVFWYKDKTSCTDNTSEMVKNNLTSGSCQKVGHSCCYIQIQ